MTCPAEREANAGVLPLTGGQEWLCRIRTAAPGNRLRNSIVADIRGSLDVDSFLAATRILFERHPGLRARLACTDGGQYAQSVAAPDERPPVNCQAVTGASREQFDAYVRRVADHDRRSRWDLVREPWCRLRLLRYRTDEYVLVATFDQLGFDDRALVVFQRDLWQAYRSVTGDRSCVLPSGSDLAGALSRQRRPGERRTPPSWAACGPAWQAEGARRPLRAATGRRAAIDFTVGPLLARKVADQGRRAGRTTLVACAASLAAATFRLTRQDGLTACIAVDERGDGDRDVIGMFSGFRPILLRRPTENMPRFMDEIQTQLSAAAGPGLTGACLSGAAARWDPVPRCGLLLDYAGPAAAGEPAIAPPGLTVRTVSSQMPAGAESAALALAVRDSGRELRARLSYDPAVVQPGDVASFPETFGATLTRIADTSRDIADARGNGSVPACLAADPALTALRDPDGVVRLHADLREVRAAILDHPAVTGVEVRVDESGTVGSEIVASIRSGVQLSAEEFRAFCLSWPDATQYMVSPGKILRRAAGGTGSAPPDGRATAAAGCAAASGSLTVAPGVTVNRLGFGAMRITGAGVWDDPPDRKMALQVLRRAAELAVNFFDTADSYGPFISEELIAEALYPYHDIVVATKGGLVRTGPDQWYPVGRPEYLRQCVEMSLRRLRLERIDLYQLHRIDPLVPLADQIGVLSEMCAEGKIANIGLSEVTVPQIAEARLVAPVMSIQNRYNLMDRSGEQIVNYCEHEGLVFIPWSPIARGQLADPAGVVAAVAGDLGVTAVQLALGWLLRRSPVILPIPGCSSTRHLEENLHAAALELSAEQFSALSQLGDAGPAPK